MTLQTICWIMVAAIIASTVGCSKEPERIEILETRESRYINGALRNRWTEKLDSLGNFVKHGKWEVWYIKGGKWGQGEFLESRHHSTWTRWNEAGQRLLEFTFENGEWRACSWTDTINAGERHEWSLETRLHTFYSAAGMKTLEVCYAIKDSLSVGSHITRKSDESEFDFLERDFWAMFMPFVKDGLVRWFDSTGHLTDEEIHENGIFLRLSIPPSFNPRAITERMSKIRMDDAEVEIPWESKNSDDSVEYWVADVGTWPDNIEYYLDAYDVIAWIATKNDSCLIWMSRAANAMERAALSDSLLLPVDSVGQLLQGALNKPKDTLAVRDAANNQRLAYIWRSHKDDHDYLVYKIRSAVSAK